jgi:SAM-dependent methyltransferase
MLDLGCGEQLFREICHHTGFEYVGLDCRGDTPMLLGDAHALPFKDQSIDFVMSLAVIEHLRYPAVAVAEIFRILKPGGLFIGSFGFLEPYHMRSYHHPSPLGAYDLLCTSGFAIEQLEPNMSLTGLRALASMSLFPHAPAALANLLVLPVEAIHRLWWWLGHLHERRPASSEQARQLLNAAGFRFVCVKAV